MRMAFWSAALLTFYAGLGAKRGSGLSCREPCRRHALPIALSVEAYYTSVLQVVCTPCRNAFITCCEYMNGLVEIDKEEWASNGPRC